MAHLTTLDLVACLSIAILLVTTSLEVIHRLRSDACEYVAPVAFGGQTLAAIGLAVQSVIAGDVLLTTLSVSVGVFALIGVIVTLAGRTIFRDVTPSVLPPHIVPARTLSIVVRPGETLASARELHRALDLL